MSNPAPTICLNCNRAKVDGKCPYCRPLTNLKTVKGQILEILHGTHALIDNNFVPARVASCDYGSCKRMIKLLKDI